jgi:phospholipid transport system substrate-binding protein
MTAHRLLLLASIIVLPLQGRIFAADESAEKQLRNSVQQVVSIAKASADRTALMEGVKPVLEKILDFDTMTKRAIGPGWRQFTPAQQHEAVSLFTTLILRTYTAKFTPGELPEVIYKATTSPAPGRVEIPTSSNYRGNHYDVVYRLEEKGGWRITDVVIEGVSLVANYRTQFDSEFRKGGATAVLSALQRSVTETK